MYEQRDSIIISDPILLNETIERFSGKRHTYPIDSLTYYPSRISPVLQDERYWQYLQRTERWSQELVKKPLEIQLDVTRGNFYLDYTRNGFLYTASMLLLDCADKRTGEPVTHFDANIKLHEILLPAGFGGEHSVWDFQQRPGLYSPTTFCTYDEHISRWSINVGPLDNS